MMMMMMMMMMHFFLFDVDVLYIHGLVMVS